MTVLCDREIKDLVKQGYIGVSPFDPNLVQPNSLDIRLGNHFMYYEFSSEFLDIREPKSLSSHTRSVTDDYFILRPRDFILARSLEIISMPFDIVGILEGKSSIARLGVTIHQTGGVIDSGFQGTITFEISNVNCRPVKLYAGMPIAQLVFHELNEFVDVPYNGKYQNQIDATVARY